MNLSRKMIRSEFSSLRGGSEFDESLHILKAMALVSKQIWDYFGHAGYLIPWHDAKSPQQWAAIAGQRNSILSLTKKLDKYDIPYWSYFVIMFSISNYSMWERPALLLNQPTLFGMMRKLRTHAGSAEMMTKLANALLQLYQRQIKHVGRVFMTYKSVVAFDDRMYPISVHDKTKRLVAFERLVDKIRQVDSKGGIEWSWWFNEKFNMLAEYADKHWEAGNRSITLKHILNPNFCEPVWEDLLLKLGDKWIDVRDFLGLTYACQFPDGYIPKGWMPLDTDMNKTEDIKAITGEGFYYKSDGSQRRGTRHYSGNRYFLIKCDPSNFRYFMDDWKDKVWITGVPTWQEYSIWAAFPGMWDVNGLGLQTENGMVIKTVRWRNPRRAWRHYDVQ